MKPSRAFYLLCGAMIALACVFTLPAKMIPILLLAIMSGTAALIFDSNDFQEINISKHTNLRCSICNCSSNPFTETNPGEFRQGIYFTPDLSNPVSMICSDCSDSIRDTVTEYEKPINEYELEFGEIDNVDKDWDNDTEAHTERFNSGMNDSLSHTQKCSQ